MSRSTASSTSTGRVASGFSGESYVAGAAALNELTDAHRVSRDLDLFHDTDEALHATWHADRRLLESHGYQVGVVREHRTFVVDLRAERPVSGANRVYTITVSFDGTIGTVQVAVTGVR